MPEEFSVNNVTPIRKGKQPLPVCTKCGKKAAVKYTVLSEPVCMDCYKKLEITTVNLFEGR